MGETFFSLSAREEVHAGTAGLARQGVGGGGQEGRVVDEEMNLLIALLLFDGIQPALLAWFCFDLI